MEQRKRYSPEKIRAAGLTTITAHSACEGTPPNSREHILAAIASGAEYIEIDVRSNGKELFLSHDVPEDFEKCVRFETLLELIAPHTDLYFNCDVKTDGLLEAVASAAKRYGIGHRVLFTGACNGKGEVISALGADLWHSLWFSHDGDEANDKQVKDAVEFCKKTACPYINLDKRIVTSENLEYVQKSGLNYSVWTPGDEEMLRFLLTRRVGNITTRQPLLALRLRDEIQGTPEQNGVI